MTVNTRSAGTHLVPVFHDGPVHINDDVRLHVRYFTYQTEAGLVSGADFSVMFTIDRPAKDIWRYLKDWNSWMNPYGYYWSGVIGDLQGQVVRLSIKSAPDEPPKLHPNIYEVLRAIPEHLIVKSQPVPPDGSNGGVSPGFHVFMLNEHGGQTIVTAVMEHATRTRDKTVEEALAVWSDEKSGAPEWLVKWRDVFIPTIKRMACGGG